ncbi:LuxR C-terminal-related transcriptional regulator [Aestuariibius sp. HNIBRBA575]|uniref:helix-turn-helix transcriptional regulator n=1 Tax=Aestuariibius sp. HNIBRBA575 TaxID=3233343 RepID=UPI0034A41364
MGLLDVAGALERQDRVEDVWDTLRAGLRREGIEFVIYLTVDADFSSPIALTNMPELYQNTETSPGETLAADPFLRWCCDNYDISLTGLEFLHLHTYLSDKSRAFIRQAAEQSGFTTGLGIPMRLIGSDRFGGFNLGTRLSRPVFEEKIAPRAEEFRFVCLLAHRRIEELMGDDPNAQMSDDDPFRPRMVSPDYAQAMDDLSPREREVLFLVARGMSRKEVARACRISVYTVSEYVQAAYRKLGISNKAEAARLVTSLERGVTGQEKPPHKALK